VTITDFRSSRRHVTGELEVPTSVIGPPLSVAVAPDESLALVTSAMKIDPGDTTKQIPHDRLIVIDLRSSPREVIASLETAVGAARVSIDRPGSLALLANRSEGKVSVFSIRREDIARLQVLGFSGRRPKETGRRLPVTGGGTATRTAEKAL